ncbi:11553_t:CDS:2, partial [Diversispora eburnea]
TWWNSSYLAWKHLIKIKNLIDILVSTMLIDNDPSVLEDFVEATEYLGGSKYTTISLMYSILMVISQKILSDDDLDDNSDNDSNIEIIDLTGSNTIFDDDVSYRDAPEDEPITEQSKRRKININIPQVYTNLENRVKIVLYQAMNHYWKVSQEHRILVALLDPRFKELEFASDLLHIKTQEQLKDAY